MGAKACAVIDAHATELAAVVIEPLVQGASGMLCAAASDVRRIGEACRQAGVLLICDEVATGFGRAGTLFASEQCGLRPDLLCLGKGITGGYLAMSATVASRSTTAAGARSESSMLEDRRGFSRRRRWCRSRRTTTSG
jgi:adenosylmethionine-8-amino-7-oxononanoate aminotransferase